jgi:hypothetical protein
MAPRWVSNSLTSLNHSTRAAQNFPLCVGTDGIWVHRDPPFRDALFHNGNAVAKRIHVFAGHPSRRAANAAPGGCLSGIYNRISARYPQDTLGGQSAPNQLFPSSQLIHTQLQLRTAAPSLAVPAVVMLERSPALHDAATPSASSPRFCGPASMLPRVKTRLVLPQISSHTCFPIAVPADTSSRTPPHTPPAEQNQRFVSEFQA